MDELTRAAEEGWVAPGDVIVTVAAIPLGLGKVTNTIRFHRARAEGGERALAERGVKGFRSWHMCQ